MGWNVFAGRGWCVFFIILSSTTYATYVRVRIRLNVERGHRGVDDVCHGARRSLRAITNHTTPHHAHITASPHQTAYTHPHTYIYAHFNDTFDVVRDKQLQRKKRKPEWAHINQGLGTRREVAQGMDGRMNGWMDGRMDGWTDGWMDGWRDDSFHRGRRANNNNVRWGFWLGGICSLCASSPDAHGN